MKNIYDIFEQRKIDSLNCDFNNIMESINELDYMCNIFENEHYESLEEAFDFKEMKKKIKSGAKAVGSAISTAVQNLIQFIKELWKKIKGWFKQVKERIFKKKDTKKIIEEKLKEVTMDTNKNDESNDNNGNDENKVDFGEWVEKLGEELKELRQKEQKANGEDKELIQKEINIKKNKIVEVKAKMTKKKVSDAEKEYREKRSQERLEKNKNYNHVPSIKEILSYSENRKIKSVPFQTFMPSRLTVVISTIEQFIEAFGSFGYEQEDAYESKTVYGYLRDEISGVDDASVDGMKKYLLGHDNIPKEMMIGDIKKEVESVLNERTKIIKLLDGLEKNIDKIYTETINKLEARQNKLNDDNTTIKRLADKNKGRKKSEVNMESIQCLRSSSQALLQISQIIIQTCESEYNRASAIALNATDFYIKEKMK